MPSSERIVTVPGKRELSNRGSHFAHVVRGPGLNEVQYASGRHVSAQKPMARLALLKDDGEIIEAKCLHVNWKPYAIAADFEFPNGLQVSQRSWVDGDFIHSTMTFSGQSSGARLIVDGASYEAAKCLASSSGAVMMEEMLPAFKPLVVQVASSVQPDRIQLSDRADNWKDTDYAWSEGRVHYRMLFDRIPREMTISAHFGRLSNHLSREDWEKARARENDVKRAWLKTLNEDVPDIDCPDPKYRDLVQYCFYLQIANSLDAVGMLPYPFAPPTKFFYPAWWMWDTGFHSMMDAWMRDPTLAFGNLLSHTILQTASGCIPDAGNEYFIDTGKGEWIDPEHYEAHPPPCTGPCMTGIAAWDVYEKTGSLDFVKRIYPHLVKYERWLVENKSWPTCHARESGNPEKSNPDPDLIAYTNWYDCGWDDSKRWGKGGFLHTADWDFPVIPVDANTFFLILRETLWKFSKLLGDGERERDYVEKARLTRSAIDRRMWDAERGFYFDLLPDGEMVDAWTPAGFVPLLAHVPDAEKFTRLRAHMLDPNKFWTKYPLPTLAIDDKDVMLQDGGWRGGTWGVVNWQVGKGLFDYDPDLALQFLQKTVDMMTRDGHATCFEYYDPQTGDGKRAVDNGFSSMPVDLILRRIFGLNPTPTGLALDPHLPPDWPEATVRNVFAAGTSVEVRYLKSQTGLTATVKNTGARAITVQVGPDQESIGAGQTATRLLGRDQPIKP